MTRIETGKRQKNEPFPIPMRVEEGAYRTLHALLTQVAVQTVHRLDVAEDLATEVLLHHWEDFPDKTDPVLTQHLLNQMQAYYKQLQYQEKVECLSREEQAVDPGWQERLQMERRSVLLALARFLPPLEQRFLELSLWHELDLIEIASLLAITKRGSQNLRDRTILNIRKILATWKGVRKYIR